MKVRETWTEIVQRERVVEVDSLEEAMNLELDLGEGDEVSIELDSNSLSYEIIEGVA